MELNKKPVFIVIYSDGPMGSTNLGAIFEQYGYLNLPFRKFLLCEYVMGLREIDDKSMQHKCLANLESLSEPSSIGGVSIKDRSSRKAKIRALKPTENEVDEFLSFKPSNITELLSHCFLFTAKHITYKKINEQINGFIIYEMPQFFKNYKFTEVEYVEKLIAFRNFKFILMNRTFKNWCASLISQQDYKLINSKFLNTISIEKLFKRWKRIQYLSQTERVNTFKLDSVLLPNTEKTNLLIASFLNVINIDYKDLSSRQFDIYGSLIYFNPAYKPSDKSFDELNIFFKISLSLFPKLPWIFRLILDLIINIFRKLGFFRTYRK